ncbi:unnamed protein product [Ilex paraguariensis]|uniref:Uncharacterized protein n=1 Tax=Ilex paraguariensis TaxID=185542 RepID=A0ABC8QQL0_9AQUA
MATQEVEGHADHRGGTEVEIKIQGVKAPWAGAETEAPWMLCVGEQVEVLSSEADQGVNIAESVPLSAGQGSTSAKEALTATGHGQTGMQAVGHGARKQNTVEDASGDDSGQIIDDLVRSCETPRSQIPQGSPGSGPRNVSRPDSSKNWEDTTDCFHL